MTLRKIIWGFFSVLILTAGFGYYSAFMSPMAVNWVLSKSLNGQGISFEPAIGDFSSGLMIPTIRKTGPDYDLSIDNVKFQYSAFIDLIVDQKLRVDSYVVDRIELDVKKSELGAVIDSINGKDNSPQNSSASVNPTDKIFSDFSFLKNIEVAEFQISNVQVRYPIPGMTEKKNLKIKKVRVSGIEIADKVFTFRDAEFKSDEAEVMMAGLEMREGEIKRIGNMVGTLKAAYAPAKMKKDVDYFVRYTGKPNSIGIEFKGFSGKIFANLNTRDPVVLQLKGFNYSEYFKESFPISNLNVELKAQNILMFMTGVVEAKGSFNIGDIPFKVIERDPNQVTKADQIPSATHRGVEAVADKGNQKFKITFLVDRFMNEAQTAVLKSAKADRKPAALGLPENGVGLFSDFPVLAFESNLTKSPQDNFAFLYYSLPYAELDDAQKSRVDQEMWLFDKSFPPAPKVVRRIQKKPVLPLRKPASVPQKRVQPLKRR